MLIRKIFSAVLSALCCMALAIPTNLPLHALDTSGSDTYSDSSPVTSSVAENTTSSSIISLANNPASDTSALSDDNHSSKVAFSDGDKIQVENKTTLINSIYIVWNTSVSEWKLSYNGNTVECGKNGFMHEYITLDQPVNSVTISTPSGGGEICDIYTFSEGTAPDWVQQWQPSCDTADILLMATRENDEFLYFGGLIPYYAREKNLKVQVAYLMDHGAETYKAHETLNGLWAAGLKYYPNFGIFTDANTQSLSEALNTYSEDRVIQYQVAVLRRFKPKVVVSVDPNGETVINQITQYVTLPPETVIITETDISGALIEQFVIEKPNNSPPQPIITDIPVSDGAHMLNAHCLMQAVELSIKEDIYTESSKEYGTWQPDKIYFHLYNQDADGNPIPTINMAWRMLNLSFFGGETAFNVAKSCFEYHKSQTTWYEVGQYDCETFGLFKSNVGADVNKNDFMENVVPYQQSVSAPAESDVPAQTPPPAADVTSGVSDEVIGRPGVVVNSDYAMPSLFKFAIIAAAAAGLLILVRVYKVLSGKKNKNKNKSAGNSKKSKKSKVIKDISDSKDITATDEAGNPTGNPAGNPADISTDNFEDVDTLADNLEAENSTDEFKDVDTLADNLEAENSTDEFEDVDTLADNLEAENSTDEFEDVDTLADNPEAENSTDEFEDVDTLADNLEAENSTDNFENVDTLADNLEAENLTDNFEDVDTLADNLEAENSTDEFEDVDTLADNLEAENLTDEFEDIDTLADNPEAENSTDNFEDVDTSETYEPAADFESLLKEQGVEDFGNIDNPPAKTQKPSFFKKFFESLFKNKKAPDNSEDIPKKSDEKSAEEDKPKKKSADSNKSSKNNSSKKSKKKSSGKSSQHSKKKSGNSPDNTAHKSKKKSNNSSPNKSQNPNRKKKKKKRTVKIEDVNTENNEVFAVHTAVPDENETVDSFEKMVITDDFEE